MSSWDGPARLRATDGAAHRVLGVVVLLLAPVVVLVVGIATPSRSPAPFAAGALAQLLGVGFLLWLVAACRRPTRRPRRADLVLVVAPVVAAVSLWLLLALAEAHGIRGSAVPRVRQGIPFAADLAYLAAVAGALATLVVAVVLLGVLGLALRASTVRPRGDAGPTVRARVLHRLGTAPADPLPPATSDDDPWLRRLLPPRPAVLLVLPAVAPAAGLLAILHGDATQGVVGAVVAVTVPVLVTAWVVLRSTWRPDAQLGVVMAALWRTMSAPFVTAAAGVPAALVVAVLPGSADRFAADRRWSAALGDVLPSPGTTAPTWVLLSALVACSARCWWGWSSASRWCCR